MQSKRLWRNIGMTKHKQKTQEQLAQEHWNFLEGLILTEMRLTMKLFLDGFCHGYKHGKENILEGIRTKPKKK